MEKSINELYKEALDLDQHLTKLAFLSDYIFEITTYDDEMSEYFARMMIEVLKALIDRKTFEYINDKSQYLNYLTMVNMPYLKDKLEWGTSVRGAWINDNKDEQTIKNIIEWVKL